MTPVSPSVLIPQNMATTSISHELQPKETSVSKDNTNFKDDDDFFLLHEVNFESERGTLKKETIAQLSNDYPGIFDGLDKPSDLFVADPKKYQPLAKLINNNCDDLESILDGDFDGIFEPSWSTQRMTYGMYKGGFYRNSGSVITLHKDHYQLVKQNKVFVSQLREFLFDETHTDECKLPTLKMVFPPIQDGEEDITIKELSENMNMLFGVEFKMAQQRAIDKGFKP